MIVVDTNVVAYLWLPGDLTEAAEQALQRDADWAAPLLWRSEFRSILTGAVNHNTLSLDRATAIAAAEDHMHGRESPSNRRACSLWQFLLDVPRTTVNSWHWRTTWE